jgi:hypothetical protein
MLGTGLFLARNGWFEPEIGVFCRTHIWLPFMSGFLPSVRATEEEPKQ